MTLAWQIILSAVQASVRGAAYIMDLSITQKMTIRAEAEAENLTTVLVTSLQLD